MRHRRANKAAPLHIGAMIALVFGLAGFAARAAGTGPVVEVVNIDGTINAGMAHRVQRAVDEARRAGAKALELRIATNGGLVDDANSIRDALQYSGMQTIAYVYDRAWSAGALISLSCDKIVMAPGSSMGAALPVTIGPGGENPVDEKIIAAFRSEMESLAEAHHRDPKIAAAMADPDVVIRGVKTKGQILSLSAQQALHLHFIDAIASSDEAALAAVGIRQARLQIYQPTLGERIAQFVTEPVVSGLLLTIGFLGLLIELQTAHLIAGVIGVLALALFFGGHIIAGAATWLIIVLFAIGVLAVLFELHVLPGHGISGLVGTLFILASIVLAFGSVWLVGIVATAAALVVALVVFFVLLRWLPESALGRRLAFAGTQSTAEGYVTAGSLSFLTGREGVAESLLRPVGVAVIDGSRFQVQSAGDFIPPQTRIRVQRVEGATIFVTRA